MSSVAWGFYFLTFLSLFIGFFVLAYCIIKKAVKNGILEAYKKIHNDQ